MHAALGNATNDGSNFFGIVFAAGNVVKKEQGTRAAADNVIDAHCNGVNADGVVLIEQNCHFDLGSATVGSGNENRLFHSTQIQAKATAKAANVIKTAFVFGARNVLFHQFNSLVTGGDIYARCGVAFGS